MKRSISILVILLLFLPGCTKVEPTRTSGTDTIDNTRYLSTTYYYYGFSFPSAKLVPTYPAPGPDIIVFLNNGNVPATLTLQANNLNPSFYKVGDYPDEQSAKTAFDNLKSFSASSWQEMADPIAENQIWIYRSGAEKYTKIRIIRTVNEIRQLVPYGECTFQWVYQPDGSLTFP